MCDTYDMAFVFVLPAIVNSHFLFFEYTTKSMYILIYFIAKFVAV